MKKQRKFMDFNQRLDDAISDCKKKCKCGHTMLVPYSSKHEYVICSWCGGRLYFNNDKQKEYDKKVAKNDFMFKLNKCLEQTKKDISKTMDKDRVINKKKLKRRYFKNRADYFTFCKNMTVQIYIVDTTSSKSGKIIVYYGAKLGRPPKNKNKLTQEEYNKRKRHYRNRYNK